MGLPADTWLLRSRLPTEKTDGGQVAEQNRQ